MSWGVSFLLRPSCSAEVKRCVLHLYLPDRSQMFSSDCSLGMKILEVDKLDMPCYEQLGNTGRKELCEWNNTILTRRHSHTVFFHIPVYVYTETHGTKEQISLQIFSKLICHSSFLIHGEIILAATFIKK